MHVVANNISWDYTAGKQITMKEGYNPEVGYIQYVLTCVFKQGDSYTIIYRHNATNSSFIADRLFNSCLLEDLTPEKICSCKSFNLAIRPYVRMLESEESQKLFVDITKLLKEKIEGFKSAHPQNLALKE